jgi:hypothetical protein
MSIASWPSTGDAGRDWRILTLESMRPGFVELGAMADRASCPPPHFTPDDEFYAEE